MGVGFPMIIMNVFKRLFVVNYSYFYKQVTSSNVGNSCKGKMLLGNIDLFSVCDHIKIQEYAVHNTVVFTIIIIIITTSRSQLITTKTHQ